jgi:hypothetical protein
VLLRCLGIAAVDTPPANPNPSPSPSPSPNPNPNPSPNPNPNPNQVESPPDAAADAMAAEMELADLISAHYDEFAGFLSKDLMS